jgi:hypothetical protein
MRNGTKLLVFAAILTGVALGYLAASGQLQWLTQA